jgi:hypothetical protein
LRIRGDRDTTAAARSPLAARSALSAVGRLFATGLGRGFREAVVLLADHDLAVALLTQVMPPSAEVFDAFTQASERQMPAEPRYGVSGVVGIAPEEVTVEMTPGLVPMRVRTPVKLSVTPGWPPKDPMKVVSESPLTCTAPPVEIE